MYNILQFFFKLQSISTRTDCKPAFRQKRKYSRQILHLQVQPILHTNDAEVKFACFLPLIELVAASTVMEGAKMTNEQKMMRKKKRKNVPIITSREIFSLNYSTGAPFVDWRTKIEPSFLALCKIVNASGLLAFTYAQLDSTHCKR